MIEDEPPSRKCKARGAGSWTPRRKRPSNLNLSPVGQVRTQVDVEPQGLRYCNAERICGHTEYSYGGTQHNERRRFRRFTPDS